MLLSISISGIWVFIVPIICLLVGWFGCNSFQSQASKAKEQLLRQAQDELDKLKAQAAAALTGKKS